MPSCYGFVILDLDNQKTILVKTSCGNLSYPKGKFEKKKDKTPLDCALRELMEETGLDLSNIDLVPNLILSETKSNGICNIQYYVGIIKTNLEPNHEHKFIFNPDELDSVDWYGFDQIKQLDKLKDSRKDVFMELKTNNEFIMTKKI